MHPVSLNEEFGILSRLTEKYSNESLAYLASHAVQQFVKANQDAKVDKLALKRWPQSFECPSEWILEQITGLQVARRKMPEVAGTTGVLFAPKLNLEQSSDERVAAARFKDLPALKRGADLTGGFGVDAFALAKKVQEMVYVEPNDGLCQLVKHNVEQLGLNMTVKNSYVEKWLKGADGKWDVVFLDPSRREQSGERVYALGDYYPNVYQLMDGLLQVADNVMIKASPMLDIFTTVRELGKVVKVLVIALKGEVKEVCFVCGRDGNMSPDIVAIEADGNGVGEFASRWQNALTSKPALGKVGKYLFEPNGALLKAGLHDAYAAAKGLQKLDKGVTIFFSDVLPKDHLRMMGQWHEVVATCENEREVTDLLQGGSARVVTKGYPINAEKLRKKLKLDEGQHTALFALGTGTGKNVFVLASAC